MKKFTNVLLSVIFTALIICSIQYASADHLLGDQGIFKDETTIVTEDSIDSKYMIHLQVVVRDAQGQLVSVSETMNGSYFEHEITDYAFDHGLVLVSSYGVKSDTIILPTSDKKEIIIIDNMKYEKVQYSDTFMLNSEQELKSKWGLNVCAEHVKKYGGECARIFGTASITVVYIEVDDVITTNWTILREFN